jgi:LCP family protein required for cell wall assembly
MMLLSIEPKDMSVSILSIPRDLWVDIPHPNHDKDRINTAHFWGEVEGYPGGGPALARQTIEYNFGVPVHYYARLNFIGFQRIIDYIGGIDIDVPYTIDDDKYPGPDNSYTHLHIEAGPNHFDGEMALKYARTRRGTGDGDFTRMERQQQVVLAIRDKVLSMKNLPQLIVQAPKLLREMGDSLDTDMPVQEMFVFADWAQQVERDKIQTATISRDVTTDWWTPEGELVLLYDRARARPLIDALFSDPTPEAVAVGTLQVQQLEAEDARVAIYNTTPTKELGTTLQSFLALQGIEVVHVQDQYKGTDALTQITVYGEKPITAEWLSRWLSDLGVPEPRVTYESEYRDFDIAITIGQDFPAEKLN